MSLPVNLHQLELFCSVVDHGSYSHAAEHLMMTQPALSLQVKALEKNLNVKLFLRKGNKIELTEAGRLTYRYATHLLSLEQKLRSSLQELTSGQGGRLTVGSNRPFGRYLLPDYVFRYMQRFPKVEVTITYDSTEQICLQVMEEKADVGLVTWSGDQPMPPKLVKHLVQRDYWSLVCSSTSPWANSREEITQLLRQAPLISSLPHSTHGKIIQRELMKLGLEEGDYQMRLRLGDLESIKLAVMANLGVAFLPHSTIVQELARGELVEIPFPEGNNPPLDFVLITKEGRYMTPTLEGFIRFFLEEREKKEIASTLHGQKK